MTDVVESAGMLADRLRPLVLASCDGPEPDRYGSSCIEGTPIIPIHRATLSGIYQHLERLAELDGETTQRMREYPREPKSDRLIVIGTLKSQIERQITYLRSYPNNNNDTSKGELLRDLQLLRELENV